MGTAWRLEIPPHLRLQASLNALEFLAAYVSVTTSFHEQQICPLSVIECITDSMSAAGWLEKSNFQEKDPLHLRLARALATEVLNHDCRLPSTWIAGKTNVIADCLSRDHQLSDIQLTNLLSSQTLLQVPPNFHIYPVPPHISSRIVSWMQALPASKDAPSAPTRSGLVIGDTTSNSPKTSNANMTHSSSPCHHYTEHELSAHSQPHTARDSTETKEEWPKAPSEKHWTQWRRSFGKTNVRAPSIRETGAQDSTTPSNDS